jgi:hypothetical protein
MRHNGRLSSEKFIGKDIIEDPESSITEGRSGLGRKKR